MGSSRDIVRVLIETSEYFAGGEAQECEPSMNGLVSALRTLNGAEASGLSIDFSDGWSLYFGGGAKGWVSALLTDPEQKLQYWPSRPEIAGGLKMNVGGQKVFLKRRNALSLDEAISVSDKCATGDGMPPQIVPWDSVNL